MDSDKRRKKHQALMAELVERKVRNCAQELYDTRGQVEGHALQDWAQAEAEILANKILAPLYRRLRGENGDSQAGESLPQELSVADSSAG